MTTDERLKELETVAGYLVGIELDIVGLVKRLEMLGGFACNAARLREAGELVRKTGIAVHPTLGAWNQGTPT